MGFFDPNAGTSELFAMGGAGHAVLALSLFGLLAVLVAFKKRLPSLRANRPFMAGTAALVLVLEAMSYLFKFVLPYTGPGYERLPLHMCAALKILVATFILLERYDLVKFVGIWSIGAGFISFANLNLNGGSFGQFNFWHYVIGHYYLFLAPLFLFLTGDLRYDHRYHARSILGIFLWSVATFFVNWIFDSNYMYSGPHNDTSVPFVPAQLMVWPFNFFSYVVTGLLLLNLIYAILWFCQGRMAPGAPGPTQALAANQPVPSA